VSPFFGQVLRYPQEQALDAVPDFVIATFRDRRPFELRLEAAVSSDGPGQRQQTRNLPSRYICAFRRGLPCWDSSRLLRMIKKRFQLGQ
jgi:hypothetical protein